VTSDIALDQKEMHMTGGVKGIPEGASVVIPRLFCLDVAAEIDFCKNTFKTNTCKTSAACPDPSAPPRWTVA
jgi:hypothetical protein